MGGDDDVVTGLGADGDHTTLGELAQQRGVAGQHAQLSLGGAGDHHPGLTRPEHSLDGHQLHLQGRHDTPRVIAPVRPPVRVGRRRILPTV